MNCVICSIFSRITIFRRPAGQRVAIIGSGPAGLAAGHDLALMGFRPTIFEMEPVPAGMLYTGVPDYRLPVELIRAEIAVIESLGVEIRCNTEIGKDISFDRLRKEFAAVIIAVGAKKSRATPHSRNRSDRRIWRGGFSS